MSSIETVLHESLSCLGVLREKARSVLIKSILKELRNNGYRIVKDPTLSTPGLKEFA